MLYRHRYLALASALAAIAVTACGTDPNDGDGGDDPVVPDVITYYQHVKPIIDAKCAQCHHDGGIAPFGLTTYDEAVTQAGVSRLAVEAGVMPPWHADDECADYVGVRALTDEQRALLLGWIDTGTTEGDPANPGPVIGVEDISLSRVDETLTMDEPYLPASGDGYHDDYRCFILPWQEAGTSYVTGFRAVPGNPAIVHHVIAFLAEPGDAQHYRDLDASEAGPGWRCFGGTGGPAQQWIGGWAPGSNGYDLPPGLGLEVEPDSLVILQVHYNTRYAAIAGGVTEDRTSIEVKLDSQVDQAAMIMPWTNPQWLSGDTMHIPANEPDTMYSFGWDPTIFPFSGADQLEIYSASLHMHLLGTRGYLSIERGDATSECLLRIDDWDFDWQDAYGFREPKVLRSGDVLSLECHWDNTLQNQPVVGGKPLPPADVFWGEGSTDEMCLGVFLIALP